MPAKDRLDQIVALISERGFLSVGELSRYCRVSEMTIRRDLDRLDKQNRIRRTFGGATLLAPPAEPGEQVDEAQTTSRPDSLLVDRLDVLITTSVNSEYDGRLLQSIAKKHLPIIAESLLVNATEPVVAVDNYRAGVDLGRWAGAYALEHWAGRACALDLTYSLSNTQARSRGFLAGLRAVIPSAEVALSINAQSRYATAYQLTRDALAVHKGINIIFAINDVMAWAAINACKDLRIDPDSLIVIPFGLEGDTMKNALMDGTYCKAGLAMFPEIVGPVCLEAAIRAYNRQPLDRQLLTPYWVLTTDTLSQVYRRAGDRWQIDWDAVRANLSIPIEVNAAHPRPAGENLPRRVGFIVPFSEHEWYKNLIVSMKAYASRLKIDFEVIDADQNRRDEVEVRRRVIARVAADQIKPGEVIIMDGGPIANDLAEMLIDCKDLTVITNSVPVFDILRQNANLTLISTGGAYRHSSQMMVGPTAEGALRELRADKLFLMVSGVSLSFGLSHTNISEVTMKQAMIHSAREVILLADHTYFGQESVIQVSPLTVVHKLITDDALPASVRLDLSKLGIQIILANE